FFSSRRRHTRFSRDWSRRVLFRSRNPTKVVMNGVGPGRAVKFVTGGAEEINILTLILPGTGDTTSNIINNAKHTNHRGRKDWLVTGLVVEADIATGHRNPQSFARLGETINGL